jgi:hypothetical protein
MDITPPPSTTSATVPATARSVRVNRRGASRAAVAAQNDTFNQHLSPLGDEILSSFATARNLRLESTRTSRSSTTRTTSSSNSSTSTTSGSVDVDRWLSIALKKRVQNSKKEVAALQDAEMKTELFDKGLVDLRGELLYLYNSTWHFKK